MEQRKVEDMEKIRFVPNTLVVSKATRASLAAFVKSAPDMLRMDCYANVDASNSEDVPVGVVMYFPPSATVDPTMISNNMFQHMTVTKALKGPRGVDLEDKHFQKASKAVGVSASPPNGETRDPATNRDGRLWISDSTACTLGAYYQLGEEKEYYLAIKGSVPHVIQDMKSEIAERLPTYGDLVSKDEWRSLITSAINMTRRNNGRNLVKMAEACKVKIPRDADPHVKLMSFHHVAPEVATPTWEHPTYSIVATNIDETTRVVALYNGVVPPNLQKDNKSVLSSTIGSNLHIFPAMTMNAVPADAVVHAQKKGFAAVSGEMRETMKAAGWDVNDHPGLLVLIK